MVQGVDVQFTTVNGGSMEFRLCEQDDPCTPVTQACLDTHLLANAGGVTRQVWLELTLKGLAFLKSNGKKLCE